MGINIALPNSYFEFHSYSIKNRKAHKAFLLRIPIFGVHTTISQDYSEILEGRVKHWSPLWTGDMFQGAQWMPTAVDSTKPYI